MIYGYLSDFSVHLWNWMHVCGTDSPKLFLLYWVLIWSQINRNRMSGSFLPWWKGQNLIVLLFPQVAPPPLSLTQMLFDGFTMGVINELHDGQSQNLSPLCKTKLYFKTIGKQFPGIRTYLWNSRSMLHTVSVCTNSYENGSHLKIWQYQWNDMIDNFTPTRSDTIWVLGGKEDRERERGRKPERFYITQFVRVHEESFQVCTSIFLWA